MRNKVNEVEEVKALFDDDSEESKQYENILQWWRRRRELILVDEWEERDERDEGDEREGIGLRKKRKAGSGRDVNGSQEPMECAANNNLPQVMLSFE